MLIQCILKGATLSEQHSQFKHCWAIVYIFLGMYCSLRCAHFGQQNKNWISVSTASLLLGSTLSASLTFLTKRSLWDTRAYSVQTNCACLKLCKTDHIDKFSVASQQCCTIQNDSGELTCFKRHHYWKKPSIFLDSDVSRTAAFSHSRAKVLVIRLFNCHSDSPTSHLTRTSQWWFKFQPLQSWWLLSNCWHCCSVDSFPLQRKLLCQVLPVLCQTPETSPSLILRMCCYVDTFT